MRPLKLLVVLLLASSFSFGTAAASGKLVNPDTTGAIPGYVQFDLQNCGFGNFPEVSGAGIGPQQKFNLASDGSWSGNLYRNDEIFCNGSPSTWWRRSYWVNFRQVGAAVDYICSQTSCVFDGAGALTPLTVYPAPAPPSPPLISLQPKVCPFTSASTWTCTHNFGVQPTDVQFRDSNWKQIFPDTDTATDVNTETATWLQPQSGYMIVLYAGNSILSTANPNYIVGNPSSDQPIVGDHALAVGGSFSAKRIEQDRIVNANTTGADWCAKVNSQLADLSANGRVFVASSANTGTCSTALTVSQSGVTVFLQAGTWLTSATLTVSGQGSFIAGQPASVSPDCDQTSLTPATIIKQANGANLATFANFSGNASGITDIVLDGNKANNTTSVVKVTGSRVQFFHSTTCHMPGDGIQVASTITGSATNNEAINFRFIESSTNRNGGIGIKVTNTADFESRGSYYELNGSYGLRLIASNSCRITGGNDFGGNNGRGIYATGLSNDVSVTGSLCDLEGNQFGNNVGSDVYVDAYDSVNLGRSIQQWAVIGNTFAGLGASASANTFDAVHFQDSGSNTINGNVIVSNASPTNRYGIFTGAGTLTELPDSIGPNSYSGTFGTGLELLASTVVQGASNENGSGFGRMRNVYWANADNVDAKKADGTVFGVWQPLDGSNNAFWFLPSGSNYNWWVNGTSVAQMTASQFALKTLGATISLPGATSGTGTLQAPATGGVTNNLPQVAGVLSVTIASGTATMTTAAITGPNCGTTVTVGANGVLTTDSIAFADNLAPAATTNGPLVIKAWPTANNVNFAYCVQSGTITPAAATLNFRVVR